MQAVREDFPAARRSFAISYEVVGYMLLIVLALWLRLAELDTVPLSDAEATQALAAWRALNPDLPGSPIVPESPILFVLHTLTFSVLGASEFSARLLTALAGAGLVLSPLLFRPLLGSARAFIASVLLAFSPILLTASRLDSPVIWTAGSAVVLLWAIWQWWRTQQGAFALAAAAAVTALVFLSDPAGWVLAVILLGAGGITLAWNRVSSPDDDPLPGLRERLRAWPRRLTGLTVGLTLLLVATAGMSYLPGLSAVGRLLETGLAGLVGAGGSPLLALLTTIFYEPFLWVFALFGVWLRLRQDTLALVDRFLIIWLALGVLATLIYQGAQPAHALWLLLPLVGLASAAITSFFQPEDHPFLDVPGWSKWVVAAALFALLNIFTINFQALARAIVDSPDGAVMVERLDPIHGVWTVIAVLFTIVGYFLVSSLWGAAASLRGAGLGLLAFALLSSLGSGWSAAVTHADNPVEFWHSEATGQETFLLRATLMELARRETGGFPRLPIYAQVDDTGIIGWLLRDFNETTYITQAEEGRAQEIVLLPAQVEPPALGGSYVGQDFIIRRTWSADTLEGLDFLAWWMQRDTRVASQPSQVLVLWLRQDVYIGVEIDQQ